MLSPALAIKQKAGTHLRDNSREVLVASSIRLDVLQALESNFVGGVDVVLVGSDGGKA
jgi:hypothetical protein